MRPRPQKGDGATPYLPGRGRAATEERDGTRIERARKRLRGGPVSARLEQWIHGALCRLHMKLTAGAAGGEESDPPSRTLRAIRFAIDVIETRWIWGWCAAFDLLRGKP